MENVIESAEVAAEESLQQMYSCIRNRRHFKLEAGAGAGKTFSLVKGLQLIIDEQGIDLAKRFQRVACITYTNVATEEINTRIDSNPVVLPPLSMVLLVTNTRSSAILMGVSFDNK